MCRLVLSLHFHTVYNSEGSVCRQLDIDCTSEWRFRDNAPRCCITLGASLHHCAAAFFRIARRCIVPRRGVESRALCRCIAPRRAASSHGAPRLRIPRAASLHHVGPRRWVASRRAVSTCPAIRCLTHDGTKQSKCSKETTQPPWSRAAAFHRIAPRLCIEPLRIIVDRWGCASPTSTAGRDNSCGGRLVK